MKPAAYLATVAGARGLFLQLFEDSKSMLPPPVADQEHDLVSMASLASLAKVLGVTPSTVRRDLVQLVNFGWVQCPPGAPGGPKRLGRRTGATYHLLADLAAEQHTKERDLVSRVVLRLDSQAPAPVDGRPVGTGTRREWQEEKSWSWGGQTHGEENPR